MVQTDLDVCNLAIGRVGGETIDAIDGETPAGSFCSVQYPQCKAWLLSKYRWSFANAVAQLNALATTPPNCPRRYQFDPPADLVGAIHDYRTGAHRDSGRARAEWSNGAIASDAPVLFVEYTRMVAEALWPTWFTELVKTTFAMGLAAGPLKNQSLANSLQLIAFGTPQEAGEGGLYGQARNEDSRNAPERRAFPVWDDGPLVNARYGDGWERFGWGGSPFVIPPGTVSPIQFIDFSGDN